MEKQSITKCIEFMRKPDITEHIEFDNKQITINWYDLVGKEVPNVKWYQVYVMGDIDGKVPIVNYEDGHSNLPGGKTEPGETVDQTIAREIDEELKMKVLSWEPLGYQEWIETETNSKKIQLRVYAKLAKEEDFNNDPGGLVIGHSLVSLDELNSKINYLEIGDHMVESVKAIKSKESI